MSEDREFSFDIQMFSEESSEPAVEGTETGGAEEANEEKNDTVVKSDDGSDNVSDDDSDREKEDDAKDSDSQEEDSLEYDFSDVWGENEEVDQQMVEQFTEKFKELNLNNEQANAIMKMGVEFGESIAAGFAEAKEADFAAKEQEVKEALGKDLEKTMSVAGAGIEVLAKEIPDLRQWLDETGLGNDLKMVKICAKLGEMVSEDSGHLGKGKSVSGGDPLKARWKNSPEMFKD